MANGSPFLGSSTPTVYIEGTAEEAERLFGGRIPPLPAGELTAAGLVSYRVQHHSRLLPLVGRFLSCLFEELGAESRGAGTAAAAKAAEEAYEELLRRILVNSLLQDRRIGLVNLFWLSHSKEIAETITGLAASSPERARSRFAVHPLLAHFYGRVWREACREVDRTRPGQLGFALGGTARSALVEAVIEDQLPLACTDVAAVDFGTILRNNSRFRLTHETFSELHDLLLHDVETRLTSAEPTFAKKLARHLPTMEPESYSLPANRTKMVFHSDIRHFLWIDPWRVGTKLRESERLRREAERGTEPMAVLEAFDELAAAVQRFEIMTRLRARIDLLPGSLTEAEVQESYRGVRIYRFGDSVEIMGNAVNATILFLDLRGFTETSEGMVSERDLTRQLYTVFDSFVEIISRFGGRVDKFIGDGMMVTFGAVHSSVDGPLNALRTAIVLQEKLRELRQGGQTHYSMGVSIHHGRVYLAHFVGSSGGQDTTVIGRNVNVAGRLSSAAKGERPAPEDDGAESTPEDRDTKPPPLPPVRVDAEGTLFNEGIALSREMVQAIGAVVPLEPKDDVEEIYGGFYDPCLQKRVLLRYAGDAKFKGLWGTIPVYGVLYS